MFLYLNSIIIPVVRHMKKNLQSFGSAWRSWSPNLRWTLASRACSWESLGLGHLKTKQLIIKFVFYFYTYLYLFQNSHNNIGSNLFQFKFYLNPRRSSGRHPGLRASSAHAQIFCLGSKTSPSAQPSKDGVLSLNNN